MRFNNSIIETYPYRAIVRKAGRASATQEALPAPEALCVSVWGSQWEQVPSGPSSLGPGLMMSRHTTQSPKQKSHFFPGLQSGQIGQPHR
jgi:hypothetical protein